MNHPRSSFLALIAAQLSLGATASAQTPAPLIRIGSTPNDSYAEPFYAEDRGFFTRDGLNATVEPFATGAGVTAALAGNAIDVGHHQRDLARQCLRARRAVRVLRGRGDVQSG